MTSEDRKQRARELAKKYYEENKEKVKARANNWNKENPDERRRIQRERYHRLKAERLANSENSEENP